MGALDGIVAYAADKPVWATLSTILIFLTLRACYRFYAYRRLFKDLPGPPHSFLLGHLKAMGEVAQKIPPNAHPQLYYGELARQHDLHGIFYIDLWPASGPQCVISDPSLLDDVTVRNPQPMSPMAADFMEPMLGAGVIAVSVGALWKKLHTAMQPAFSWQSIRGVTGVLVDEGNLFRRLIDDRAKTGEVFSFEELISNLLFDVMGRIVFNTELHAQTKGSPYLVHLTELINLAEGQSDIAVQINPFLQLYRRWRRWAVQSQLHPPILKTIHDRYSLLKAEKIIPSRKDPYSILDLMLRENIQAEQSGKQDKLPDSEAQLLLNNIKGLLVGGITTTADSLCYITMLLSKHPEVIKKLAEERRQIFGTDTELAAEEIVAAPEKLQELPYTEAVIKEGLRLFPVGFGVRRAPPGATVVYNGQTLPLNIKEATFDIALNGFDTHYNEAVWPNPTKFDPERWLDDSNPVSKSNFRTFSRGSRACLGQNLAMNEMKVVLALLVRDFEFTCVDIKPNSKPKLSVTNLDTIYGDIVFQELAMSAGVRGGMMVTAKRVSQDTR